MYNGVLFRPTPLNKCLLGIGLPIDKESFLMDLQDDNKDFAKRIHTWKEYEQQGLWIINEVLSYAKEVGVNVIDKFTINDLRLIEVFDVITIVGHGVNKGEKIELADKIHSIDGFISAIPFDRECFLELVICNSYKLQKQIKKKFKNINVLGYNVSVALELLLYYKEIIRRVKDYNMNYLDAYLEVKTQKY
jgi:hypothetical protein